MTTTTISESAQAALRNAGMTADVNDYQERVEFLRANNLYSAEFYDRHEGKFVWYVAEFSTGRILTRQVADFTMDYESDIMIYCANEIIYRNTHECEESENNVYTYGYVQEDPARQVAWHNADVADVARFLEGMKPGDEVRITYGKVKVWREVSERQPLTKAEYLRNAYEYRNDGNLTGLDDK